MTDSVATITPERLTALLRRGGVLLESSVTAIAMKSIGAEFGFLDALAGLTLTYDREEAGAPRSLVVKASSSDVTYRQIGEFYNAYEREAKFYESVAPHSPIRLPRCFGGEVDSATNAHFLFLEDLRALSPGDQVRGLTPDQAQACVETIGRFHAAWWDTPRLESLDWMPTRNLRAARYRAAWSKFKDVIGSRMSASQIMLGERLLLHFEPLLAELERRPHTIVHSDFRADNLLFAPASATEPVVVLDWQLAIRGRGILDVARLLCGSMMSTDRAASEFDLLKSWHQQLLDGGVRDYSFQQAVAEYRRAVLMCLYYPVTIHEAEEAAGQRGTALAHAQIERFCTAAEQLSGS